MILIKLLLCFTLYFVLIKKYFFILKFLICRYATLDLPNHTI